MYTENEISQDELLEIFSNVLQEIDANRKADLQDLTNRVLLSYNTNLKIDTFLLFEGRPSYKKQIKTKNN